MVAQYFGGGTPTNFTSDIAFLTQDIYMHA
jgi:hypothetical protein